MERRRRFPGHTLLVGCAGIAIAFIASSLIAQRTSVDIEGEALAISFSAAPNIEAISGARAELRHLETLVLQAVEQGARRPLYEAEVASVRREIDARLARYVVQGGRQSQLLAEFHAWVRRLDLSAERTLALSRNPQESAALREEMLGLHRLSDSAALAGANLIEAEADRARGAALEIERVRRRSNVAALLLDALCGGVAAAVAGLLYKSNRRFQKLEDEHRRGLQLRADELEQFAGRVAHDILGPLGAVSMALSIIERSATPPATRQNALARAAASLTRVQRLVDGLLDFARAGAASGPDAAADVRASVLGLLDELQPEAVRARISLAAAPVPSCAVAASQGALLSLLGNLLRNAIKYMGTSEKREVALRIAASRGSVRFEVEDTGPGIPPHLLERIFQPYVRAPGSVQPGIGLGLATVKRLVDAHGGAVGVKAAPAGGALFWFELPRAQDDAPGLEASPMVAAASEGPA